MAHLGMKDEALLTSLRSFKPDFVVRLESIVRSAQEASSHPHQKLESVQTYHKGPVLEM